MAATFHQVIVSDFADLKNLMDAATAFLENQGVDAHATFRINLTLEEIVTNIIKYGHDEPAAPTIDVALKVDPDAVEAVIIDEGHEFNPMIHEMEKPSPLLTDRTTGGLGIFLVKKLMSQAHYRREGHRNIVEVRADRKRTGTPA